MLNAPYPSVAVRFVIYGVEGEAVAIVDTGFDGYMALPEALLVELPPPRYLHRVQTASGEIVHAPAFLGTVELMDLPAPIDAVIIVLGDEYLVGLGLLNHFSVTFDHGRRVIVNP